MKKDKKTRDEGEATTVNTAGKTLKNPWLYIFAVPLAVLTLGVGLIVGKFALGAKSSTGTGDDKTGITTWPAPTNSAVARGEDAYFSGGYFNVASARLGWLPSNTYSWPGSGKQYLKVNFKIENLLPDKAFSLPTSSCYVHDSKNNLYGQHFLSELSSPTDFLGPRAEATPSMAFEIPNTLTLANLELWCWADGAKVAALRMALE